MQAPTGSLGVLPVKVLIQNGPCGDCKHWIDVKCWIHKAPDEDFDCQYFEFKDEG